MNTVHKRKTILIAPSWQNDNIMDSCIEVILNELLKTDYIIILRPHPEYIKRKKEKLDVLLKKYSDKIGNKLLVETDFSSNTSIFSSDLLISDWSGIAYEFAFATKKPVLFINTPMKVMNPEYTKIDIVPLEITLRNQVGFSLNISEIPKISHTIDILLESEYKYKKEIENLTRKYFYNFGQSSKIGAEYILNQLRKR